MIKNYFTRYIFLLVAFVFGLLATKGALAANQASELDSLQLIAPIVNRVFGQNIIDVFVQSALSIAQSMTGFALTLAGLLAVISTLWAVMVAMTSKSSPLVAMMEPLIFAVLTYLLLTNYAMVVGDVVNLGKKVVELSGSTIGDAFQGFVNAFVNGIISLWNMTINRDGNIGLLDFFTLQAERIIVIILLIIALLLLLFAVRTLISVVLLGPVTLGVGIAVGPLLIATLAGSYTRKWVDQWLAFLINAAVLTGLVVVVLVLLKNSVNTVISDIVQTNNAGGTQVGGTLGRVLALAVIIASMESIFAAIPDMASAMLPGRLGAGGKTISSQSAAGAAGKALLVAGAGGSLTKLAGKGFAAGYKKARSGKDGDGNEEGGKGGGGKKGGKGGGHQAIDKANASTSPMIP